MIKEKKAVTLPKKYELNGRSRVVITNLQPAVEDSYPVKRVENEWMVVEADVLADGHDLLTAVLQYRKSGERKWREVAMKDIGNDRWTGSFQLVETGLWEFTVRAFIDHPLTWQHDFKRRLTGNETKELDLQLQIGIQWLEKICDEYPRVKRESAQWIKAFSAADAYTQACSDELNVFLKKFPVVQFETNCDKIGTVVAHRKRAGFSAWYSFFPRSAASAGSNHGTFKDCEGLIPRIAELGFDVIYLTPIHPIGNAFRKGKNDSLKAKPGEPGSPYGIGSDEGGHKDIHSGLGTLDDFRSLIKAANKSGIEIAMDFALQCSPDHPYVKQHPQWFKWRPDGTVQYAENPPKKYQDVLPFDFENYDWQNMWLELKGILDYWISQGVKIFRVDNPHTKSFQFWEWCLAEINKTNPEVIFLSEAFTRQKVMFELAKKGYHQSYTYFSWRNSKAELMQYMDDLVHTPAREFFRPNFWPNTHDINPYITQSGQEAQFLIRYFLAATLSSNYGIFGPVFELMVHDAVPGKEEYLDSEKYEVRHWDWSKRNKLTKVISMVNECRNKNEALQYTNNYTACSIDNSQLMAYFKCYNDNRLLLVVNLDAWNRQSGMVQLPVHLIGKNPGESYIVHDLLTGDKYTWQGGANYVELDPHRLPFHLFRIE